MKVSNDARQLQTDFHDAENVDAALALMQQYALGPDSKGTLKTINKKPVAPVSEIDQSMKKLKGVRGAVRPTNSQEAAAKVIAKIFRDDKQKRVL